MFLFNGRIWIFSENNPCNQIRCGPEEECSIDRTGKAACICPPVCEPVLRRVCGNDSTTYDNECELRRRSCQEKIYVVVNHTGHCGMFDVVGLFRLCELFSILSSSACSLESSVGIHVFLQILILGVQD